MAEDRVPPEALVVEARVRALRDAGDLHGAATEIIRHHGPRILRYLRSLLREEETAEDAFALFAEQIWTGLEGFRGDASVLTWSYTVAWRAALRQLRDPYRRRRRPLEPGDYSRLVDEVRQSTLAHLRTEVRTGIARLRDSLQPEDQTLLYLRIDQQMAWKDVAEVLTAEGAVVEEAALRKRFERVKRRLREIAVKEGLVPP